MFALMKPYAPAPPPGAQPPPLWGDERHVAVLLGDRVERTQARRQSVAIPFATGAEFRDYFKQRYGPTIAVYRNLGADAERASELDRALAELGEQHLAATGTTTMSWEYQLMTAIKR
jgi:hypothetical protein